MGLDGISEPLELDKNIKEDEASRADVPMSGIDFVKFTQLLIEDKSIPQKWAEKFWAFSDREMAVGYIEKSDVPTLMNMFDVARLDFLMSKPDYDFNWEDNATLSNLRTKFFVKVKRSVNATERRLLATQIRQIITDTRSSTEKAGFIKRLFGMGGKSG